MGFARTTRYDTHPFSFENACVGFPVFLIFKYLVIQLLRLVGVRKTTHARHHAQHVVVHGVHSHLSRAAVADRVDGDRQLEGRLVNAREVARATGLVLLGLQRKGVHADALGGRAGVVLEGLHAVEVAALTLREPILTVELQLGDLSGRLALALDTRVEHHLRQQVVGRVLEDLVASVGDRVQPGSAGEGRTDLDAKAGQVGAVGTIVRRRGDGERRCTATQGATGKHIHDDTLRGEVIRVVEGLDAVHLVDEVLARRAVDERVALDNPHKLLDGVVEVQLDLVGGGRDRLSARELELLNQVLVRLLGEPATLLRVEVDIVDVQGGSRQGLDRRGSRRRARQLVVAAVQPLLELHVDAHLVVLEGDQGDRKTRVAAEPELQGDVQRLRRRARAGGAGVRQLRTGAGGIQLVALVILHQDQVVRVANHVIKSGDRARILGQLRPDLHPVAILAINALATNLKLNRLDQAVADVVQPAEARKVRGPRDQVNRGEHNLDVRAVHQVSVTVDDRRHTLVEVGLAVEGHLNGLHGEVRMPLVQDLPERDLGVARNVNVLRTIAHKLKKTTTHVCCVPSQYYFPASFGRTNPSFSAH